MTDRNLSETIVTVESETRDRMDNDKPKGVRVLPPHSHVKGLRRTGPERSSSPLPGAFEALDGGPYLSMVALSEGIELEPDGALSLRRLIERVEVEVDAIAADGTFPPTDFALGLLVAAHAGRARGEHWLGMTLIPPSGQSLYHRSFIKVEFTDDVLTFAMASMQTVNIDRAGTYWFEIEWAEREIYNRKLLTRVPFTVDVVVRQSQ